MGYFLVPLTCIPGGARIFASNWWCLLKQALHEVPRHMLLGKLLQGSELGRCQVLVPPGGWYSLWVHCFGLSQLNLSSVPNAKQSNLVMVYPF